MTPREFSGWVPAERHVHYDTHGNETGYTIVEREARIDDADRVELLALAQYEAEVCSCGWHPIIADDPANTFTPEDRICPNCAGMAVWGRIKHEDDERVPHDAPARTPRPSDGRHSYMRMLTPQQAAEASPGRT